MPTIDVTIPRPVLEGSEYFRVRWRAYPNGSFSSPQSETNAPFTISVPAAGDYEVEIVFVKSDSIECEAVYYRTTVAPDFVCGDVSRQLQERPVGSGIYYDRMTPSGSWPPCGYRLEYGGVVKTYATMPPGGVIEQIATDSIKIVRLYALLCNGNEKLCFQAQSLTPPFVPTPCVPATAVEGEIILRDLPTGFHYVIYYYFNQSNPQTKNAHFTWQQLGTPRVPGTPLDSGSFIQPMYPFFASSRPNSDAYVILRPNMPTNTVGPITYLVRMKDDCGNWNQLTLVF